MRDPLVQIRNAEVAYQEKPVLRDINFTITHKDFIGVIGPNGGGKTSLVKVILGILKPQKGEVTYSIEKSDIGYLPQGNQVDEKFPILSLIHI